MVRCFVLLTCLHVCRGVLGLCDDQTLKGQRPKDINGFETSCQWILIACTEANLCASISPVPFGPWGWRLRRGRGRWARGCRTGRSTPTPTATTGMTSAPENEQTCTSAITTVWALDREHVRTHRRVGCLYVTSHQHVLVLATATFTQSTVQSKK